MSSLSVNISSYHQYRHEFPINAYCLEWHVTNSRAFYDLLVEPLQPYATIELNPENEIVLSNTNEFLSIFCQVCPPKELLKNPCAKIVWLPMWDQVAGLSQSWWNTLPKTIRIVAFSEAVARMAEGAQLPTLRLRYYKNPQDFVPVSWDRGRVLMYWNRRGIFHPRLIKRLCACLKIRTLLLRNQIDPGVPSKLACSLPNRLGQTNVESIGLLSSRESYLHAVNEANIFIAPRKVEGVGMTFLEAMARGCVVLALDNPSMNEYIHHGEDGLLLKTVPESWITQLKWRIRHRIARLLSRQQLYRIEMVTDLMNWRDLEQANLPAIGERARQRHSEGFALWQQQIPNYADFVLNWD